MAKKDPELDTLTRYAERKLTRARAAKALGVSERQLTRRMQETGLERIESERHLRQQRTQDMREIREAAARLVANRKLSVQQAAARAGCNQRTIYRYVARLKAATKKGRRK